MPENESSALLVDTKTYPSNTLLIDPTGASLGDSDELLMRFTLSLTQESCERFGITLKSFEMEHPRRDGAITDVGGWYARLGWPLDAPYDVIASWWTLTKHTLGLIAGEADSPLRVGTKKSFAESVLSSDASQDEWQKLLARPAYRDLDRLLARYRTLTHSIANFTPIPDSFGRQNFNMTKNSRGSDFLNLVVDWLQSQTETPGAQGVQTSGAVQQWHAWFCDEEKRDMFALHDHYEILGNMIVGKPLFPGQTASGDRLPSTLSQASSALDEAVRRIEARAERLGARIDGRKSSPQEP